jgi:DAPG hydrolase PhiG domain
VELENAAALLDPGPLPLEMGIQRLESGPLHVAARTDMYRCSGRMFEWWFRFAPDTQQYAWWHPVDHVSSAWRETNPRTHVGSTHLVEEKLGGDEVLSLEIAFQDPALTFGEDAVREARQSGAVSALVCAHLGAGEGTPRDEAGRPLFGRLAHIGRDTPWGMVLRSRFWLGVQAPEPVPDEVGLGLMQHAYTEFHYLSKFLPSLYIAENRELEPPPFPW